jgi:subtilase family serine protease
MKSRYLIIMLLAALVIFPVFSLSGNTDQAKQQAQVSQANLLLRPDLAMGKIWIVKAGLTTLSHPPLPVTALKKGGKYLFYCQYSNPGRALHGFWKLGYYVDGEMFWNQSWGDVFAGATQTKYSEYTPMVVGPHTYACQLDYDKEIVEKDETNNKAKIAFTVIQ